MKQNVEKLHSWIQSEYYEWSFIIPMVVLIKIGNLNGLLSVLRFEFSGLEFIFDVLYTKKFYAKYYLHWAPYNKKPLWLRIFISNYKLCSIWEVNKSSWQIMICMQNSYYYMYRVKDALHCHNAAKKDRYTLISATSRCFVNKSKWQISNKSLGTFCILWTADVPLRTIQNFDSTH